jgi:hypothetical protein
MNSCTKESTIVPQLLYLPGVHFNQADGAGDGRSLAGYGDHFILAFSNAL